MNTRRVDHPIASLGPFDLVSFLGKGAMGQVWRAVHRDQQIPAAIKVITEQRARREHYRRQFHQEVRAVAGLSHPGIVSVFDYGTVTDEVEQGTFGELLADSPYLAMELCPRGSLADLQRQLAWKNVRSILLSLLDALAHAHSRGVVHRDIKPANILLGDDTGWTGVKLTDFGLAFVIGRDDQRAYGANAACGTPAYMSPEQLQGQWRDVGAWTDLYALGCLAYEMVCGHAPFEGRSIVQIAQKHLQAPIPALDARIAVPEDFEAWVRRLMQKNPMHRYRNAADAAWALFLMDDPTVDDAPSPENTAAALKFDAGSKTVILKAFDDIISAYDSRPRSSTGPGLPYVKPSTQQAGPDARALEPCQPPVPLEWHHLVGRRPSMRLLGAGLGLYGLRHIPVVGRTDERDVLWHKLCEVNQMHRPRAVLLRGPAGTGKSCLAGWLAERAHETGAATTLRASHSPGPAGGDGLGRMLASYFRTDGLDRAEILARFEQRLRARGVDDPYEWQALTEIVAPASDEDIEAGQPEIQFAQRSQRYAAIAHALSHLAAERPVVVHLDDLQWSADALGFLRYCLVSEATRELAVLFVGTLRDEALVDEPLAQQELDKLAGHDGLTEMNVAPLSDHEQAELIERLLYLEPALARKLAARTGGNPLFAVQLVGDWVDRGVLEAAGEGFVLSDGEDALIPDDIFAVWTSRLDKVLADADAQDLEALELAAALGQEVAEQGWRACCDIAGYDCPARAVDLLLAHRLIEDAPSGYRFVHGMLCETIERRARAADRWSDHHATCATMLVDRFGDDPSVAERLGRHWMLAGRYADAIDPLLIAAREHGNGREFDAALLTLDLRLEALDKMGAAPASKPRIENMLDRALALGLRGDVHARDIVDEAVELALEHDDDPSLAAAALARQGTIYSAFGDYNHAIAALMRAADLVDKDSDPDLWAHFCLSLGSNLIRRGRIDESRTHLTRALEVFNKAPDSPRTYAWLSDTHYSLGIVFSRMNDPERAREHLERALEHYRRAGHALPKFDALVVLADLMRSQGDLDEAVSLYQRVYREARNCDPMRSVLGRLNLGLVLVLQSRYREARVELQAVGKAYERVSRRVMLAYTRCVLLPCLAFDEEWSAMREALDFVLEVTEDTGVCDADLAAPAQRAAEMCLGAGQREEAMRLLDFAASQWQKVGEHDRADQARQKITVATS